MTNLSTICSPYIEHTPRYNRTPKNTGMGMRCSPGAIKMDRPETAGIKIKFLSTIYHFLSVQGRIKRNIKDCNGKEM